MSSDREMVEAAEAHLPAIVLLKDGNFLHEAIGREHGVDGIHCHGVGHVLNLHDHVHSHSPQILGDDDH